jgi:hypothetical protein
MKKHLIKKLLVHAKKKENMTVNSKHHFNKEEYLEQIHKIIY